MGTKKKNGSCDNVQYLHNNVIGITPRKSGKHASVAGNL